MLLSTAITTRIYDDLAEKPLQLSTYWIADNYKQNEKIKEKKNINK